MYAQNKNNIYIFLNKCSEFKEYNSKDDSKDFEFFGLFWPSSNFKKLSLKKDTNGNLVNSIKINSRYKFINLSHEKELNKNDEIILKNQLFNGQYFIVYYKDFPYYDDTLINYISKCENLFIIKEEGNTSDSYLLKKVKVIGFGNL